MQAQLRLKKIKDFYIYLNELLGSGAYGEVYKGIRQSDKLQCAIKIIGKKKIKGNDYLERSLMRQIQILQTIKSQNIVGIIDILESENNYYIIQQICDNDLQNFILQNKVIPQNKAISILFEIVNGFTTLVKNGIVHRDLKPANILIKKEQIKIADFGFAKNNTCKKMKIGSCIGTPLYMSPQILKGQPYSSKCDVWGLGIIFYELLHKKTPWNGENTYGLLKNIKEYPLKINPKFSPSTIDFLEKCLQFEENKRLTWDQVFSHSIFNGMFEYLKINKSAIQDKLKMVMRSLRQQIDRKSINIKLLLETMQLKDQLSLQQFTRFISTICQNLTKQEIIYIFDKIDTDNSGTVQISQIEAEMAKHDIEVDKQFKLRRTNTFPLQEEDLSLKSKIFKEMLEVLKENGVSLDKYFYSVSNGSASINFEKFKRMMRRFGDFQQAQLLTVFKQIDLDNSNSIEYQQIKLAFCHVNHIPDKALQAL